MILFNGCLHHLLADGLCGDAAAPSRNRQGLLMVPNVRPSAGLPLRLAFGAVPAVTAKGNVGQ